MINGKEAQTSSNRVSSSNYDICEAKPSEKCDKTFNHPV